MALEEGPPRLPEDHANARRLAEGVAELLPGAVDLDGMRTNVVFVTVAGTGRSLAAWVTALAAQGVLVITVAGKVRMLTHGDVAPGDVDTALAAWRTAADKLAARWPARRDHHSWPAEADTESTAAPRTTWPWR